MDNKCDNTGMITHVLIPKNDTKYWVVYHKNEAKQLKKLIRQYRRGSQNKAQLCHMLINLRTWSGARYINRNLKDVLVRKDKHRECWIKEQVLVEYGRACFFPNFTSEKVGNRTYFYDGKYYDFDVEKFADLPF